MPVRMAIQTIVQTIRTGTMRRAVHLDRTSHIGSAPPHPLLVLLSNCETGYTEVLGHLPDHSIAESSINKDRDKEGEVDQGGRAGSIILD
jgi:hypothetical protein